MLKSRRARLAIAAAFFAYVVWFRTDGIASTFQCLADQIRDWRFALGGWSTMPLAGPPSFAGGRSLGPVYYWFLWFTNLVIGPFTDHLPHAGGIGTALLQSVADVWLFLALSKRLPIALALATSLFIATGPFDVGLSATIWNPPVSTALVKITMALVLASASTVTLGRLAAIATVAWLAVQAHSTAIFIAGPLFAALVGRELWVRRNRRALAMCGVIVAVIAVLQVPFAIHFLRHAGESAVPTKALGTLSGLSGDLIRGSLFRTVARIAGAVQILAFKPPETPIFPIAVVAAIAIVLIRYRRDLPLIAITAAPFLSAVIVFLAWRARGLDDYFFETITPPVFVCFAFALAAIPWRRVMLGVAAAVLVLAVALQPLRFAQSKTVTRFPWYGPLIAGVRDVARTTLTIKDIKTELPVDITTDIWFLYAILGGHEDRTSDLIAVIDTDGTVEYRHVPR